MAQSPQGPLARIRSAFSRLGSWFSEAGSKITSRTSAIRSESRRRQDRAKDAADAEIEMTAMVETGQDEDDTQESGQEGRTGTDPNTASNQAAPPPPPAAATTATTVARAPTGVEPPATQVQQVPPPPPEPAAIEPAAALPETGSRSLLGSAINQVRSAAGAVSTIAQNVYLKITRQSAVPSTEEELAQFVQDDSLLEDQDTQAQENTSLLQQTSDRVTGWLAPFRHQPTSRGLAPPPENEGDNLTVFHNYGPPEPPPQAEFPDFEFLATGDVLVPPLADALSRANTDAKRPAEPVESEIDAIATSNDNRRKPLPSPMAIGTDISDKLDEIQYIIPTIDRINFKIPAIRDTTGSEISHGDKRKYLHILQNSLKALDNVNEWIDHHASLIKTVRELGDQGTPEDKELAETLIKRIRRQGATLQEAQEQLNNNLDIICNILDKPIVPMTQTIMTDGQVVKAKSPGSRVETTQLDVTLPPSAVMKSKDTSWQNHVFADAYKAFDAMAENTDFAQGEVLELESDNLDLLVYTSLHAKASLIPARSLQLSFSPASGRVLKPEEENTLKLLGITFDPQTKQYKPGKPENLYALTASRTHYDEAQSTTGKIFLLTPENQALRETLRAAYEDNKQALNLNLRGTREQIKESKLHKHISEYDLETLDKIGKVKPGGMSD